VKLVFGHISYLLGKCDAIFAPAYYFLQPDRYSCPKFLGVPDIAKSIFSQETLHLPRRYQQECASLRHALEQQLGVEVIVPPHADCPGAIGAAFLALDNHPAHTQFKGLGLAEFDYQIKSFTCQDCENRCEITQIMQSGDPIASSDPRCGKINF